MCSDLRLWVFPVNKHDKPHLLAADVSGVSIVSFVARYKGYLYCRVSGPWDHSKHYTLHSLTDPSMGPLKALHPPLPGRPIHGTTQSTTPSTHWQTHPWDHSKHYTQSTERLFLKIFPGVITRLTSLKKHKNACTSLDTSNDSAYFKQY